MPAAAHRSRSLLVFGALFVAGVSASRPALSQGPTTHGVVTPPHLVKHADAIYPEDALHAHVDGTVVLFVTVGADGLVADVSIAEPAGHGLDEAAIAAVRQWQFDPARRDGLPIATRIRVPFHFAPPESSAPEPPPPAPAPGGATPPAPAAPAPAAGAIPDSTPAPEVPGMAGGVTDVHTHAHPAPAVAPLEVAVVGRTPMAQRTSSDYRVDHELFASAPRRGATDALKSAPGFYVSEPEGPGGPSDMFVRGFAAEHGRDLEVVTAGVPMNQPSHVHAHGYADQRGILPETIREVRVREGVFDPRQGEFAVAGSIEYELGVVERGVTLSASYGQYRTARIVGVWAPKDEADETFGAFAYSSSAGSVPRRAYESGVGTGQYAITLGPHTRAIVHVSSYAGRSGLVGVVREDDVNSGVVGLRQGYDEESATHQGLQTSRHQLSIAFEGVTEGGARYALTPFVALTSFRLRENFTGYTHDPAAFAEGRADLYDERNDETTFGASGYYRTEKVDLEGVKSRFEVGALAKHHAVTQADGLLFADGRSTWSNLVDAAVGQSNVGAYGDADLEPWSWLRVRGGVRAEVIAQSVDDHLTTPPRVGALPGVRADTLAAVFDPRVSLEVLPTPWLRGTLGYGQGFRSAPARVLVSQGSAPISRVQSFEAGATVTDRAKAVAFGLTAFRTTISDDLEFDPTTGTVAPVGATARTGFAAVLKLNVPGFLTHQTSATYAHAVLVDPPAPQPGEPEQHAGDKVPNVPPLIVRADTVLHHAIAKLRGDVLEGTLGSAQTFLSRRPVLGAASLPTVFLLDARAGLKWRVYELGVSAENVLGSRWIDDAFAFESAWRPGAAPSAARHFVAGAPRTVLATVTLHL